MNLVIAAMLTVFWVPPMLRPLPQPGCGATHAVRAMSPTSTYGAVNDTPADHGVAGGDGSHEMCGVEMSVLQRVMQQLQRDLSGVMQGVSTTLHAHHGGAPSWLGRAVSRLQSLASEQTVRNGVEGLKGGEL